MTETANPIEEVDARECAPGFSIVQGSAGTRYAAFRSGDELVVVNGHVEGAAHRELRVLVPDGWREATGDIGVAVAAHGYTQLVPHGTGLLFVTGSLVPATSEATRVKARAYLEGGRWNGEQRDTIGPSPDVPYSGASGSPRNVKFREPMLCEVADDILNDRPSRPVFGVEARRWLGEQLRRSLYYHDDDGFLSTQLSPLTFSSLKKSANGFPPNPGPYTWGDDQHATVHRAAWIRAFTPSGAALLVTTANVSAHASSTDWDNGAQRAWGWPTLMFAEVEAAIGASPQLDALIEKMLARARGSRGEANGFAIWSLAPAKKDHSWPEPWWLEEFFNVRQLGDQWVPALDEAKDPYAANGPLRWEKGQSVDEFMSYLQDRGEADDGATKWTYSTELTSLWRGMTTWWVAVCAVALRRLQLNGRDVTDLLELCARILFYDARRAALSQFSGKVTEPVGAWEDIAPLTAVCRPYAKPKPTTKGTIEWVGHALDCLADALTAPKLRSAATQIYELEPESERDPFLWYGRGSTAP